MKTLKMEIELTYDDDAMHGSEKESLECFFEQVMLEQKEPLLLHSVTAMNTVGKVKVLSISANDEKYSIFISKKLGETK